MKFGQIKSSTTAKQFDKVLKNNYTELLVYFFFILLNSWFIFDFKYIASLDGPQHIYNSHILIELIKSNPYTLKFFEINDVLVGYWSAHALLTFFNSIFPAFIAEKLFLLTLAVGVPFAFRYFIRSFSKKNNYLLFLVLPFVIHQFFLHGYYAFCLGWLFFFISLGYFFRNYNSLKIKSAIILSALLFGTYLTHMIVYAFTLFFMFSFLFIDFFFNKRIEIKSHMLLHFLKGLLYFAITIPSLLFATIYYKHVNSINLVIQPRQFNDEMLWNGIVKLDCLVAFNHNLERPFNQILFYVIAVFFIISLIYFGLNLYKRKISSLEKSMLVTLLFSILIMLLVYFQASDLIGTGAIKFRVLTFVIYLIVIFITLFKHKWYLQLVTAVFMIYYVSSISKVREENYQNLSDQISDIKELENKMKPNSTFIALNLMSDWNNGHFPLYIGSDKNLISLQNPQCNGHFPVVWSWNTLPAMYAGEYSRKEFQAGWYSSSAKTQDIEVIDYIVVFGNWSLLNNESNRDLRNEVFEYYEPVAVGSKGYAGLYQFRNSQMLDSIFFDYSRSESRKDFFKVKQIETGLTLRNVIYLVAIQKLKNSTVDYINLDYYLTAIYNTPSWIQMVEEKANAQNREIHDVATEEAKYMLNRYEAQVSENKSETNNLDTYIEAILTNQEWKEHVQDKSNELGIPFYEMVLIDAKNKYDKWLEANK